MPAMPAPLVTLNGAESVCDHVGQQMARNPTDGAGAGRSEIEVTPAMVEAVIEALRSESPSVSEAD